MAKHYRNVNVIETPNGFDFRTLLKTDTRDCLKDVDLLCFILPFKDDTSTDSLALAKGVYLIIGLFDENSTIVKQHHLLYLL